MVRETDGPVYKLIREMEGRAAPYFWSSYLKENIKLHPKCITKSMNCWDAADCVGWEDTTWDNATGRVTNPFLTQENSYTDTVNDDFAAIAIG